MAGELIIKNGINVSGSIIAQSITGSFTGSFEGTSTSSSFATTSSVATFASTASFINPLTQSVSIKGRGTTSSTTSLLVQNSAGNTALKIDDDLNINLPATAPKITLGGDLSIENTPYSSRRISIDILNSNINLNAGGFGECYFIGNRFTTSRTAEYYVTPNGLNYTGGALITAYNGANGNILLNASNNGNRSIQLTGLGATGAVLIGNISTGNGTSYSSILRADSTTQGFLPPRTNLTSNISSPAQGLQTYITASATEGLWYYNSGSYQGWTRVLNNSGSQSITGSLQVTGGITGSLLGTGSYATQALSSSFAVSASRAVSASYAPSIPAFPYTGSAEVTGSLSVVGTTTVSGSIIVQDGSMGIVSTGTTNATEAFKVQNATPEVLFNIKDDGELLINTTKYASNGVLTNNAGIITEVIGYNGTITIDQSPNPPIQIQVTNGIITNVL